MIKMKIANIILSFTIFYSISTQAAVLGEKWRQINSYRDLSVFVHEIDENSIVLDQGSMVAILRAYNKNICPSTGRCISAVVIDCKQQKRGEQPLGESYVRGGDYPPPEIGQVSMYSVYKGTPSYQIVQEICSLSVGRDIGPSDYRVAYRNEEAQASASERARQEARRAQEAREEQQRRVQFEQDERDRAEFRAVLAHKDPQAMYLAAGKYQRNGDRQKAISVYEKLIERFSSSSWAVKANDQILQASAIEEMNASAERLNSQASQRAFQSCRIEVESCYSRGGKDCYRDCNSLRSR